MESAHLTPTGTPYTVTSKGPGLTRVAVGTPTPKAAKTVQRQASGVYHSLDGQSFPNLDAVADGMRWAL